MRRIVLTMVLALAGGAVAVGETTREAAARLAVDVVVLREGREARGSILDCGEDGRLSIAVRREWLRDRQAEWAAELDEAARGEQRAVLETLIERTRTWLAERSEDGRLCAVVGIELERFERQLAGKLPPRSETEETEFILVTIPGDRIRRISAQPAERKHLALVAWQAGMEDVESLPANRLRERLDKLDVDWRTATVDLSDRLGSPSGDSEREWAARKALYEYTFGKRVEFQGSGDFVVRTGAGAAAPGGLDVLGGLLQGGAAADLTALVQDALGDAVRPQERPSWLKTAATAAEREGACGFRVTRTAQDLERQQVTVEDRLVARMPDGTWETIWLTTETLDASQPRQELEARIREDSRVVEALKVAESLGLGGGVNKAVRFGAATMAAQQAASGRTMEFIDRYTLRLDGPVPRWALEVP